MSQNTFAVTKDYNALSYMYNTPWSQTYVSSGLLSYNQSKFNIHSINELATRISSVSVPSNANYLSYTGKFNLLTWTDSDKESYLPNDYGDFNIYTVKINGTAYNFESANVQRHKTDFWCDPLESGIWTRCRTFTYQVSFVVKNIPSSISNIVVGINYDGGSLFTGYRDGFNAYFEPDSNNYVSVDFAFDYTSALLQQQIQQQDITINSINNINDTLDEHYKQEQEAYDNISNQSSSDINGSTDNKTTSLINVITGFIGAFSGINPTNCNLTLEFPDYAGGSRIVNICSGKEKAPRIVEIGSSLLLICVFVPLAFVLIRMIYNEIRSWTNG